MYIIKNIPANFCGVEWIEPPEEIKKFVKQYGDIDIAFADDDRVDRSYRFGNTVMINS